MKKAIITIILISIFFSAKCEIKSIRNFPKTEANVIKEHKGIIKRPQQINYTDIQTIDVIPIPDEKSISLEKTITDFSLRLFSFQSNKSENSKSFCVSPVSLQIALAMTYLGAKGITAEEMHKTLGFSLNIEQFINEMHDYYMSLKKKVSSEKYEFSIANRIFVEQTLGLLKEFEDQIDNSFEGDFEKVDFINNADFERTIINQWVEEMTKQKIKELIPEGAVNYLTKMVLVNAIYFKSDWKYKFEEKDTELKTFYTGEKGIVEKEFMIQKFSEIKYTKHSQWQALEMEYVSPEFSLLFILPEQSTKTDINTRIPNTDDYDKIISGLRMTEVYVEIPKFKIESSFKLKEMMQEFGMNIPFSDFADFSGITPESIKISEILQKVFFEINEAGSEAAAATAVVMQEITSCNMYLRSDPIRFIANRPFIFVLKENTFNTPLFIGQYTGR